jgi:hypothetical protein
MNFKKALLTLPLLALSVAPALQAGDHTEREAQRRAEKAAERRVRHGYYNNSSRYNQYYDNRGYPINPAYTGNAYRNPALRQMDRNHDGVVSQQERAEYYRKNGYLPH